MSDFIKAVNAIDKYHDKAQKIFNMLQLKNILSRDLSYVYEHFDISSDTITLRGSEFSYGELTENSINVPINWFSLEYTEEDLKYLIDEFIAEIRAKELAKYNKDQIEKKEEVILNLSRAIKSLNKYDQETIIANLKSI